MSAFLLRPMVRCHCSTTPSRPFGAIPAAHSRIRRKSYEEKSLNTSTAAIKAAATDADGNQGVGKYQGNEEMKAALYLSVEGIDRGIFGVTSTKTGEILELVELLEAKNPTPNPTDNLLDKVNGCWKLVYSTISILGAKRTKLGLRDFITLGDFIQKIDATSEKAFNVIKFNARGFKMLNGQLTIEATYKISSKTRVHIKLENSTITPSQLMNLFERNYHLLLAIFNPEGWLDITYVDDSLRIGRDDKGNIFVLERTGEF